MIVGIDIDDTITNHCESWFQVYNDHFKTENVENLKKEDAYKWSFYDDWNEDEKNRLYEALLSGHPDYYKHLKLLPDVKGTIAKIINSGNKVIIISATSKNLQEDKKKWILEQIPILTEDDIIFTTKKSLINVDVMIDDNLDYAKDFSCPYLLYLQPWNCNRPQNEYPKNVIEVIDWNEIEKVLIDMKAISATIENMDIIFSNATQKLIDGIKNAKTDKECMSVLNPYIKLWQQQGMLIGMKQINEASVMITEEVMRDMQKYNK